MGQTASFLDSSDEADSEQQQNNLQYQRKISAMEAAGEIDTLSFDDFLIRLEDLEKLQYLIPEANAKDQIKTLKMELKFLKTFSKCIARNGNLKDISASATSAIKKASWGLFSKCPAPGEVTIPVDAVSVVSDALEGINGNRSDIIYSYEQVSASNSSTRLTVDLVLELINDLMENLKDLLRCKAALVVSLNSQIVYLKEELQFLQNFLDFAGKRCSDQESIADLLTHGETVAISLAHLCYTLLANNKKQEAPVEMNLKLSVLLQKMKPTKPEVRQVYIRVLTSSQFLESSDDAYTIDKHVLGAFVGCLQHYLLEFLNSEFRFKHLIQDQLEALEGKLRFLRILLMDPPMQYIDMRAIDIVIIVAGLLLFSHNIDEMNEACTSHMNLMLMNLIQSISRIEGLAREIYLKVHKTSRSKFPVTGGLDFLQSFVENLNDLLCGSDTSIAFPRYQIERIKSYLETFTFLLKDKAKQLDQHDELRSLWTRVMDIAYQTEYVIDSFLVNNGPAWYYIQWLSDIIEEIQHVKAEIVEFNTEMVHETKKPLSNEESSRVNNPAITEVVGFEDEEEKLIDLLTRGSNQLDVVSLVGMAGLGKTTLSYKIFNSHLVVEHFNVRGWCSIPEGYQKEDILISLLNQIPDLKEGEDKVDDDDLEQVLFKRLKGRKFLIVLDNILNIESWRNLKISFPDDKNWSRIMFTTRHLDVAIEAQLHSDPHSLRPFSDNECWKLLERLVFPGESCDTTVLEIGKQIAKSCKGVPLSVSLIAGILATNKTWDFWNQVLQSLTSRIFDSPEGRARNMIEMSYKHLPYHLRPCFLYFGAFLENQGISVKRLIWLWTAEGLVRKSEGESIEESAGVYLNTLISRSLVSISKWKADGGIKECRVHDLLSHFCKVKSREENFWQFDGSVSDYGVESSVSYPDTPTYEQHRLCMFYQGHEFIKSRPLGSHVRSLLVHNPEYNPFFCGPGIVADISCISNSFRLLKVLDFESVNVHVFPDGLEILVLLKYLALRTNIAEFISKSIGSLWNLETFVLKAIQKVKMPETIWKMRKLRHLHIHHGFIFDSDYQRRSEFFSKPDFFTKLFGDTNLNEGLRGKIHSSSEDDPNQPQMLTSLETISNLCLFQGEEETVLRQIPNVRKLRCSLEDSYDSSSNDNQFPNFNLLSELESLHVSNHRNSRFLHSSDSISFPSKLKKLTLTRGNLRSADISKIGGLENLAVLKLHFVGFEDSCWDMIDEEFPNLRHLELKNVDLEEWIASCGNFPCLQRLKLLDIYSLKEVPSCFGCVQTLRMIEVKKCHDLDMESLREIQEEQVQCGNDKFRVIVV